MNGRDTYTHSSLCAPHWSSRGAIFWQLIHGCAKKSSRHEHGSAVQHSSSSPPTRLAWVEKTMCVCVFSYVCVEAGLAHCHLLCLFPPPSLSTLLSLSHCRHRKSTAERAILTEREAAREREREREELADQGLVVTRASRLSISPPSSWQAAGGQPRPCVQTDEPH